MKKRLGFIGLLMAMLVVLSGCTMKMNVTYELGKDGKVKATIISAMDDEMIDGMLSMAESTSTEDEDAADEETEEPAPTKTYTDAERWEYLENSEDEDDEKYKEFTKTKYEQDGFKGYVYTKVLGDIDELSISKEEVGTDKDTDDKIFVKNGKKYTLNYKADENENYEEQSSQYEGYGAMIDAKLTIKLPKKALKNNATEVSKDGLTYTWDLTKTSDVQLEFEYTKSNLLMIILIILGVVVVGGVLFKVLSKKKPAKEETPAAPQPVETPVMPEPVQPEPVMTPEVEPTVEPTYVEPTVEMAQPEPTPVVPEPTYVEPTPVATEPTYVEPTEEQKEI